MGSFSLFHWVILGLIVYFVYRVFAKTTRGALTKGNSGVESRIRGDGTYSFEAVGESRYQKSFIKLFGESEEDWEPVRLDAHLVLDDGNKHDPNAVRVDINGLTVGFLSLDMAKTFRKTVKRDGHTQWRSFKVGAEVRGGWDRGGGEVGMYGVWLGLPSA